MNCFDEDEKFLSVSSESPNENMLLQKCLEDSNSDALILKSHGLTKLPAYVKNINKLVSIILEENLFCELPSELCFLRSVKVLNVARNKIRTLPDEMGNLVNLEILNISENCVEKLPRSLYLASKLMVLNASKNMICEIPDEYKNLKKLTVVNFSYNKLTEVPIALTFGSHCISVLDLSHNNITDFSKEPKCSASLNVIKINNNQINDLPHWIRCLQTVEEIHLGHNPFKMESRQTLDSMVPFNANAIKKFSIAFCGLMHLPACLKNMTNLLHLDAGNEPSTSDSSLITCNTIWDASPLLNIGYLRELRLPYVSLPVLPDNFWLVLKCLEVVDLRGNNLTWLPGGISSLCRLILCNLSCNRLALLPADIGNVKSLKELNLDGNKLCELPDSLGNLENLEYLDLYDNELCEFSPAISQLSCLKYLDMEMNHFSINQASNKISGDFSANYSAMKIRLRSFHSLKQNRMNGMKELPQSNDSEDNSVSAIPKSRSPSPDNFECHPDIPDSFHTCYIGEEEDWDKSDGSDNFFDPNYSQALKDSAARSIGHWARDNGRWEPPVSGDVFCPADIHPDSLPRPSNKTEASVNDGQFDDADEIAD